MSNLNDASDDFDKKFLRGITLKCACCGLIFKKEHQYVCPSCASRNVAKPSDEEFEKYYNSVDE